LTYGYIFAILFALQLYNLLFTILAQQCIMNMINSTTNTPMETKNKSMPFILGEELVPVREAQKNITKYFSKGIVRVTKNGRSLGYLIADDMLAELIEAIESSNPHFLARMDKIKKTKKHIPLNKVLGEYGL